MQPLPDKMPGAEKDAPAQVKLGEKLYFERRLSVNGKQSCNDCHREYDAKRHPKLKHALSGGQDPNRPGKGLDCASCHDPHTPVKLSRIGPMELRKWCQGCHSTP